MDDCYRWHLSLQEKRDYSFKRGTIAPAQRLCCTNGTKERVLPPGCRGREKHNAEDIQTVKEASVLLIFPSRPPASSSKTRKAKYLGHDVAKRVHDALLEVVEH